MLGINGLAAQRGFKIIGDDGQIIDIEDAEVHEPINYSLSDDGRELKAVAQAMESCRRDRGMQTDSDFIVENVVHQASLSS